MFPALTVRRDVTKVQLTLLVFGTIMCVSLAFFILGLYSDQVALWTRA